MTVHHSLITYSKRNAFAAAARITPANNGITVGAGPRHIAAPLLVELACAGELELFTPLSLPLIAVMELPSFWPFSVMTVPGALSVDLGSLAVMRNVWIQMSLRQRQQPKTQRPTRPRQNYL